VLFQSHLNGDAHLFTPESTVDVQLALGSDIMMVLDECIGVSGGPRRSAAIDGAHAALGAGGFAHYRRIGRKQSRPRSSRSCRAGCYADLRRWCAARLLPLEADGYAIGGLSVGEPRPLSLEMVEAAAPLLPRASGRAT
jgi:queuine tRNA-ribosyltransferase